MSLLRSLLVSQFLAIAAVGLLVGCGITPSQQEQQPFEGDAPTEATLLAPGVISDSASVEFGISFSPDARTAYFTSKKSENSPFAIYTARYDDGEWRGPTVAPFSGEHFDADAFVTADGSRLFFFSMRPEAGSTSVAMPDIWYVEQEGEQWGPPIRLGPPVNLAEAGEGFVTATRNGTLYFSAMNRTDATGDHDVYRAERQADGTYAPPEYLDLSIIAEYSNPFIAPSEEYLIIDSKQPGGYGGSDLYVSFWESDAWTEPQNLGPLVNTEGEEGTPALSPDGQLLFFSRDGDIYYISVDELTVLTRASE